MSSIGQLGRALNARLFPQHYTSAARVRFDPLVTSLTEVRRLLDEDSLTSEELVHIYLEQINKHNDYLRAVSVTTPKQLLLEQARKFDAAKKNGVPASKLGSLGGIPILIKESIATDQSFEMDTTAGALALTGAKSKNNADVLLNAGAIILGKTSVSELSFFKGVGLPCGWSATVGQVQSAYVRGGVQADDTFAGHSNPGGSSTGSSVAVSAGFSPAAIGEETDGSIVMPSNRAALYSIKPTPGLISNNGLVPVSTLFDVPGPMAKTAEDLGILMDALVSRPNDKEPNKYLSSSQNKSWQDLRVGVLDPEVWQQPAFMIKPDAGATKQMITEIKIAYETIRPLTKAFHENIELHFPTTEDRTALAALHKYGFKRDLERYLNSLEYSKVHTLDQLVQFNKAHADQELPKGKDNQDILEECLNFTLGAEEYSNTMEHVRSAGRSGGIDQALDRYGLDVIIGPADSPITKLPSFAGYPAATLPLSYLDLNGRPFGLIALARSNQEELLLRVQGAWNNNFQRKPPAAFDSTSAGVIS